MNINELNIVIYGAGAVGSSVYGWIAPHYERIFLLARGKSLKKYKSSEKLTLYRKSEEDQSIQISVNVIGDLTEKPTTNVVVITVKNYDLEKLLKIST